jgi:hypothetical protein
VLNPEVPDASVGATQGKAFFRFCVRETGRVKVHADFLALTPIDPALEMLYLDRVAIYLLPSEIAINRMQIQAVITWEQTEHLL